MLMVTGEERLAGSSWVQIWSPFSNAPEHFQQDFKFFVKKHSLVFLKASGTSDVLIAGACRPGWGVWTRPAPKQEAPQLDLAGVRGAGMRGAGQPQLMGPSTVESVQ